MCQCQNQDKMGTIVRLQGLDTKASTEDIRSFFEGVRIPDGGVFIVGGAIGEAYIAFSSEADAQLAVKRSGDFLKDSKVDLHMSSMAELEHKLQPLLKRKRLSSKPCTKTLSSSNRKRLFVKVKQVDPRTNKRPPSPTNQPTTGLADQSLEIDSLDSKTAFLLGVCTLLKGLESSQTKMDTFQFPITEQRSPEPKPNPGYIRVFGLPASTTKNDICQIFNGLKVQEVIVNVDLGVSRGCLVKFNSLQDSHEAMRYSMGSACVEVRAATEKMWISALQECEDFCNEGPKLKHSPLKDTVNYKQREGSRRRQCDNKSPHKSPKKLKNKCHTTTAVLENLQHIVLVSHLPMQITKTEIKELFGCPNIAHTNILYLLDSNGNRTDKAFLLFNSLEDYNYALNLSGCHVGSHVIEVSSITKEEMKTMLRTSSKPMGQKQKQIKKPIQKRNTNQDVVKLNTTARTCLYLRNMPENVRRNQIKALFSDNKLNDNDITLLHDSDGQCIGEAVVQFHSQTNAAVALIHHGKDFLGSKVLLTPICVKQMEDMLESHF